MPPSQGGSGALNIFELVKDKAAISPIGGDLTRLTNKTGGVSEAGRLIEASTTTDDAFEYADANGTECMGIIYEDGVPDGDECWIAEGKIAEVLFEDNHGPNRHDWVATSISEAGYATSQESPAASPQHFREIGHCIQSVSAGGEGTHVKARCLLHFN